MAVANPYQHYQQQQAKTAPPDKLLLMLFDGAIRFCRQAIKAIEDKDVEKANNDLLKVQNIIEELQRTLDMDCQISKNLAALYDYLLWRLIQANLKKDAAIVEEVLTFLADMRKMWAEAAIAAKTGGKPQNGGVCVEG